MLSTYFCFFTESKNPVNFTAYFSSKDSAKAVDLFHGSVSQILRYLGLWLVWAGRETTHHPITETLACQFNSCQVYQKQHKMFATVRLRKALSQNAEQYEKCLGLIKQNPLSSSCALTSSWKKKSLFADKPGRAE